MKYKFSNRSRNNLKSVHIQLISLCEKVLQLGIFDFGVTCGERDEKEQDRLYFEGRTQLKFPNSKHNTGRKIRSKSEAIDFILYVNGKATYENKDKPSYYMAIGIFRAVAADMGIKIRCGADWDGDFSVTDQSFHDLPHIEIILES